MKTVLLLLVLAGAPALAAAPAAHRQGPITKLEQAWITAAQQRDTTTLEHILADDFVDINVHGVVRDKQAALAARGAPPGTTQTLRHLHVRHFGNVAVANGTNIVHSTAKGWTVRVAFTDVFVRRHGRWQAVSAQETLRQPTAAAAPTHH